MKIMKKFILLLLALFCAGFMIAECRADEEAGSEAEKTEKSEKTEKADKKEKKKKSSSKSQRQKARKQKKNKGVKLNRNGAVIQQEIKEIHELQDKLLRNKDNAEQAKKLVETIQKHLKKNAALLKQLGKIQGIDMMTDIEKLIKEGKKLAPEGEEVTDSTALELLQKKQLELIDKFRKGEK